MTETLAETLQTSGYFDTRQYFRNLSRANLLTPPENEAVNHYITVGERNGIAPSCRFDPRFYLAQNPDLTGYSRPLLYHYLVSGKREHRVPTLADMILDRGLENSVYPLRALPFVPTGDRDSDQKNLQHLIEMAGVFDPRQFFSADLYRRLYPEVSDAGVDPLFHFLAAGHNEGRESSVTLLRRIRINDALYDPAKPTFIVGTHDLTTTGAPLVALNLAAAMADRFNIVFLAQTSGDLAGQVEDRFFASVVTEGTSAVIGLAMTALERYSRPIGAIFSSVECDSLIEAMADFAVPSLLLVHEYTEYTFPRRRRLVPLMFCEAVVFSSQHLKASWHALLRDACFAEDRALVCPQPQIRHDLKAPGKTEARKALAQTLNTDALDARRIVIGAGQGQLRKGTDLFLQVADHVTRSAPGQYLFLWIGELPDDDEPYLGVWLHAYLRKRIDANPDIRLLPAGPLYSTVQASADAYLLTSRLDPMPNVVLDAAAAGQTLFYFEDASGISEFSARQGGIAQASPYLDIFDMAEALTRHFADPSAARPGTKHDDGATVFEDYGGYADWLVSTLETAAAKTRARAAILPPVVDPAYVGKPTRTGDVSQSVAGAETPAAIAGAMLARGRVFLHPSPTADAFAVVQGETWTHDIVALDQRPAWRSLLGQRPVSFHIHATDTDALGEVLNRISGLGVTDIVITAPEALLGAIRRVADGEQVPVTVTAIARDKTGSEAFLDVMDDRITARPEGIFGHLTLRRESREQLAWLQGQVQRLLHPAALAAFASDSLGLSFPDDPEAPGWGKALALAEAMAAKNSAFNYRQAHPGRFPANGMFWTTGQVAGEMDRLSGGLKAAQGDLAPLWPWVCHSAGLVWATLYETAPNAPVNEVGVADDKIAVAS